MPIKNTDIVLFQSQDNTDNDNGGGARTNNVVEDGAVNNLFPDISRVDTVAGDVALRKVFPVVNTDSREIYYGAHAMIRKTPDDERVSALLFYTDDAVDTRIQAQADVESYLVPSFQTPFYLFGSNIEGAKAVTFLQRLEEDIPLVGEVFLLREESNEQYFRVSNVEDKEIILFFDGKEYRRRRLIITIDQPLKVSFTGSEFDPSGQQPNTCDTFATQVADAAKFYGNKPLTQDALAGDTLLQLSSIYEQLVPASKQQTPIINQQALQGGLIVLGEPNSPNIVRRIAMSSNSRNDSFGVPVVPGSIQFSSFVDDGLGTVSSGTTTFTVDYTTGDVTLIQGSSISADFQFQTGELFETAIQYSSGILVTTENQGTVYIQNVAPVPTNGSCYVDYRANGKWYRITGKPDGSLEGAGGIGAGLINNNGDGTATISVTLGRVPDIDSTVIFSWGSLDMVNRVREEALADHDQYFEWQLPHKFIDPANCSFQYFGRGSSSISTVDFSTGLTQTAQQLEFTLDPIQGVIRARWTGNGFPFTPGLGYESYNATQYLELDYNYADPPTAGETGERKFINNPAFNNPSEGTWTYNIGETITPEGLVINLTLYNEQAALVRYAGSPAPYTDVTLVAGADRILRLDGAGSAWGTVDTNGLITINIPTKPRQTATVVQIDGNSFPKYQTANKAVATIDRVTQVEYSSENLTTFPNNFTGTLDNRDIMTLKLVLLPNIVGNFHFGLFETTVTQKGNFVCYVQGNEVYQGVDTPRQIGQIEREKGILTIDFAGGNFQISGNTNDMDLQLSNLFVVTNNPTSNIRREVFKAGATDLVTSSFILRYSTVNGQFVATTNASGEFSGTDIDTVNSYVDVVNGAVYVEFTADINPDTLRFDCVAQTTLPLDPELLGLNPVRLPPDGKVPIFYPGAFVVIFNEESTAISTPSAGTVETLGRSGQSYIEVVDANGQRLAYDQYVSNREAGTVTFADPLALVDRNGEALTAPYSIIDRVEDMAMCTDASVTGSISISAPLSRDYLGGQTRVASALVWGDIGSRVFNLFSQQSFDVWSDNPTTSGINAQFDNVNFPIQINNKDSFTGRWAFIFTSSTTVDVISEKLGTILEDASINADIAPINPATGLPYFTVPSGGWGGGWLTSNVLRFNTESGAENMWVIRTVQSGALSEQTDSIDIEIRGDVN